MRLLVLLDDGRHGALESGTVVLEGTGDTLGPAEAGALTLYHGVSDAVSQVLAAQAAGYRFAGVPELEPQQARAGRATSPAKARASRANGPKGGRPAADYSSSERDARRKVWAEAKRDSRLRRRLESLGGLQRGWDSYDAEPPNEVAIANAAHILTASRAKGSPSIRAVLPSVEGGVGVVFGSREMYADIECYNTGGMEAITSAEGREPQVWTVEADALAECLDRIAAFLDPRKT